MTFLCSQISLADEVIDQARRSTFVGLRILPGASPMQQWWRRRCFPPIWAPVQDEIIGLLFYSAACYAIRFFASDHRRALVTKLPAFVLLHAGISRRSARVRAQLNAWIISRNAFVQANGSTWSKRLRERRSPERFGVQFNLYFTCCVQQHVGYTRSGEQYRWNIVRFLSTIRTFQRDQQHTSESFFRHDAKVYRCNLIRTIEISFTSKRIARRHGRQRGREFCPSADTDGSFIGLISVLLLVDVRDAPGSGSPHRICESRVSVLSRRGIDFRDETRWSLATRSPQRDFTRRRHADLSSAPQSRQIHRLQRTPLPAARKERSTRWHSQYYRRHAACAVQVSIRVATPDTGCR